RTMVKKDEDRQIEGSDKIGAEFKIRSERKVVSTQLGRGHEIEGIEDFELA
ncbi:UNVERIFIED_CONTAM: hypothetical protein Sindi_1814400, partial [Sesamum indicum]